MAAYQYIEIKYYVNNEIVKTNKENIGPIFSTSDLSVFETSSYRISEWYYDTMLTNKANIGDSTLDKGTINDSEIYIIYLYGKKEALPQKFLDASGVQYLWSKISMEDYPNNEVLVGVIDAIDEAKADKKDVEGLKQQVLPNSFIIADAITGASYTIQIQNGQLVSFETPVSNESNNNSAGNSGGTGN